MRGIFYNSKYAVCSIWESGKMVYDTLARSDKYTLDYSEEQTIDNSYDFAIFNYHIVVNNWATPEVLATFNGKNFCVVLEVGLNLWEILRFTSPHFQTYLMLDPTIPDHNNIYGFPRPLENFVAEPYIDRGYPVIGSFGFATQGKDWDAIVTAAQEEFDTCLIRFNIPPATYVANNDATFNQIREKCQSKIYKPGVKLEITNKVMNKQELVQWCGQNTINCFFYNRFGIGFIHGLAATPDQAIIARRPLLVTNDPTFRHILKYTKPYPDIDLRTAIETTGPHVDNMFNDWSNFTQKFERILMGQ